MEDPRDLVEKVKEDHGLQIKQTVLTHRMNSPGANQVT